MTTSRFASQYERLRADHDKIKAAKSDIHSLITTCASVNTVSDHESLRTVLRKALNDLDSAIMAYGSSMGKLRRKVEHMLSDTGERKEAKDATSIKLPSGFDLIHSQLGPIIFGSQSQNVNESTEDHEAAVCFGIIIDPGDQEAQAESDDRLDRITRLMFNVDGCSDYEDNDDSLSFHDSFNDDHAHLIPFQLPDYFPP